MECVHLTGTEEVSNAARTMRDSAATMQSAANIISEALEKHSRFMDDWILQLTELLERENR